VLVLGMHRSGTSALTRLVHLLGVPAGPPTELMEAAPSNTSGHWEVTRLSDLDDALLADVGARWSGPPPRPVELDAVAAGRPAEAKALWREVFGEGPAVWKDPRACLTLPVWRQVLPAPVAVVVLRDPVEVARSLAARNGFSLDYGLALWERYLRSLLTSAAGLPAHVLRYADLLAAPRPQGEALASFLSSWVDLVEPGERAVAWASVDAGQRHHAAGGGGPLSDAQQALVRMADDLVGTHTALPTVELPAETPGLSLAFVEHARMAAFEDDALRLAGEKQGLEDELARQVATLTVEVERRSAEASRLAEDVIDARAQIDELQATLDRIRARLPYRAYQRAKRLGGRGDT